MSNMIVGCKLFKLSVEILKCSFSMGPCYENVINEAFPKNRL